MKIVYAIFVLTFSLATLGQTLAQRPEVLRVLSFADWKESQKQDSAARALRVANKLTVEDYFEIYLREISTQEGALLRATRQMKPEEVAEIIKLTLKSNRSMNLTQE